MALKRRLTAKHRQTWPYPPRRGRSALWTVLAALLVAVALIGAGVLIGVNIAVGL